MVKSGVRKTMEDDITAYCGPDAFHNSRMGMDRLVTEGGMDKFAVFDWTKTMRENLKAVGAPLGGLTNTMLDMKTDEIAYHGEGTAASPGITEILAASTSRKKLSMLLLPGMAKLAMEGKEARRAAAKAESLAEAEENLEELKNQASRTALVSLARRPRRRHDCLLSHRTKSIPGRRSSPWPRRPSSRACEEPASSLLVISH